MNSIASKITDQHLIKLAIVYIRQSTLQQIHEHKESTARQYNLAKKARKLGWPEDMILIIDEDQGRSGASATQRSGFQHLVGEVALGKVGAVFGLEVSRLARDCGDFYQLLKLCTFTGTLIIDGDGIYDLNNFNDRLVLGLKGTLSEAELHFLKSRMYGGRINCAKEGNLRFCLPIGFIYDHDNNIIKDPNQQVQESLQLLFKKFRQLKSARSVVRYFNEHNLLFPGREQNGDMYSPLTWRALTCTRVRRILKHPFYAGAYAYGRTIAKRDMNGNYKKKGQPMEDWKVLIQDHHPGYIDWEQYLANIEQLKKNTPQQKNTHEGGLVREGPALLQGIVYCGVCGHKMGVRYGKKQQIRPFYYLCDYKIKSFCGKYCQSMNGIGIDRAVADLFLEAIQQHKLNIALRAIEKFKEENQTFLRHLEQNLERAKYDADRSRRQYYACEPENRLVAKNLETQWNNDLEFVERIEAEIENLKSNKAFRLTDEEKEKIEGLARDLPRIWYNEKTSSADRKRLLRILISDVTLTRTDQIAKVTVCWKIGTTTSLEVPLPKNEFHRVRTSSEVIARIRELVTNHTDEEIADLLTTQGFVTGRGNLFTRKNVRWVRFKYNIPAGGQTSANKFNFHHDDKSYSTRGLAEELGIAIHQVYYLRDQGIITGVDSDNGMGYQYNLNDGDLKGLKDFLHHHTRNGRLKLTEVV